MTPPPRGGGYRRGVRWIGLLVVLLSVAGCSTAVEGAGSAASPSGIVLPPRPREIPLDGVDPCSLLTEQQRGELGLDGKPLFDSAPSVLYSGAEVPLCAIRGFEPRAIAVGVSIVTNVGIELFTSGKLAVDVRPLQVEGFPAVIAIPSRFTEYCSVVVDVAPGQLLDIQFRDGGRKPPIPQDQLCRDAVLVAGAAVSTLTHSR